MEGFRLVVAVNRGDEPSFTVEVTRVPFTIGASPRCDVVLDDPWVSRKHAVVTLARGSLQFADSSTNGSFFRGQRCATRALESGDVIEIPPFALRFEYELAEAEERQTTLRDLDQLLTADMKARMHAAEPVRAANPAVPEPTGEPAALPLPPANQDHEDVFGPLAPQVPSEPRAPVPAPEPTAAHRTDRGASPPGHGSERAAAAADSGSETEGDPARDPFAPGHRPTPAPDTPSESTAIEPPPPVVPPHRSLVLHDQLPPTTLTPASPAPGDEPPTIAFAAVCRPPVSPPATDSFEGTVHLPIEELTGAPNVRLQVVDGPPELLGQTFPLPRREVTLGRGDQADIRLDLGNVSRLHASLTPEGQAKWLLQDLASLNGTFVAGQRVSRCQVCLEQEFRLADAVTLKLVPNPS